MDEDMWTADKRTQGLLNICLQVTIIFYDLSINLIVSSSNIVENSNRIFKLLCSCSITTPYPQ